MTIDQEALGADNSEFTAGTNEYAQLLAGQSADREAFAERLEPSPETDQFKEEMAEPRFIEDFELGLKYGVYELNRDKPGNPLVINLAWSVPAGEGWGRYDVNEFVRHIDRPIKVIDMVATGQTEVPDRAIRKDLTLEGLAAAQLRVLDKLGVDKFDISGYSLGGVMAVGVAAQAGERVGQVITLSAPSFEDVNLLKFAKGFAVDEGKLAKEYAAEAVKDRPSISEQANAANAESKGTVNVRNATTLIKLARLMTEPAAAAASEKLAPTTRWTDVVGSKDAVTAWTGHLAAVRRRNAQYPHSSTEHVLGSESHGVGVHRPAMAEVVSATLRKAESRS